MSTPMKMDVDGGMVPMTEADLASLPTGGVVVPVPASITRGQCARELFEREMISGPEMVAMTTVGAPPAFIASQFDLLPERERLIAYADFARGTYLRANPRLNDTLTALGSDAAGIDAFFRAAADR
jgi:hypothetical protein